ncbi:MAG: tetratricopeptide repeat-containing serine/threonine-protein kinase [Acidobacteriota bacterium]|nr:tetratricopeptide repeat-containing serine/threonine-protein kinase [Acidobacteriota bacterium]
MDPNLPVGLNSDKEDAETATAGNKSVRWQLIEEIFHHALTQPEVNRAAFLESACAGDEQLKREVESLLGFSEPPSGLLERAVQEAANEFVRHQPETLPRGSRLDHYEILEPLGAGGMGRVYLALDLRLKRKVAVKVLSPGLILDNGALRRFEGEAQAVSALNHPNILTIFEFGHADGLDFMAAEFIEGPTLRELLDLGKLDRSSAVDIAIQVCTALAAAHASGVVHRDIKPENVMVRADGVVKILDFGIAKLLEAPPSSGRNESVWTSHTGVGAVLGTPRYMSPEQARGTALDSRTDIFSFGALLYEMVAGRAAFDGDTTSDVIAEILKGDPLPLADVVPEVPAELRRIIGKALQKERDRRYQTARDLLTDLQSFKQQIELGQRLVGTGNATPAQLPSLRKSSSSEFGISQARGSSARNRFGVAAAAAAIAVVLVLAYLALKRPAVTSPNASGAKSLAVLPFQNLKQDPASDFLKFSLADAIITKLGYVKALAVRPSSTIERYRNTTGDLRKIASELGVNMLLTGAFIREGDDLRVTTQLVDAKRDVIMWRDTLDVKYSKLLTVHDQVSQRVVKGLELRLSPAEEERLKPEPPIDSSAYEYYLRGTDLYSIGDFLPAIAMLEKSASIAPDYALTWAHLGRAYTTNASLEFGGREQYRKAQTAYEKAIALSPALPEPRIYMANLLTDTGRVEQAVPLLRVALQSSPNNAEAHWELGYAYRFGGMLTESVLECERARQLDPEVKINSSALNSYLYLGEYDKFLDSLPANDSSYLVFYRGFAEYYKRDFSEAARHFDRAYELTPSLLQAQVGEALRRGIAHQNERGLKLLRATEANIDASGVSDAEAMYKVAQAYAALGDKTSALHVLRRTIDGGFFCASYFDRDPLLDSLRGEHGFKALMNQARRRQEQFRQRFSVKRAGSQVTANAAPRGVLRRVA